MGEGETSRLPLVRLRDIMTRRVVCVPPRARVRQMADIMRTQAIGCLPVVEGTALVGIVTSRDLRGVSPELVARAVMSRPVVTAEPRQSVFDGDELMRRHGIEHLPVVDRGWLVGLVSARQLAFALGRELDTLTGLFRPAYLWHILEQRAGAGQPSYLLFLDLDGFGELNKREGHLAGDRILVRVAALVHDRVRDREGCLVRYGGDEFVALVDEEPEDTAGLLLEAVRQAGADLAEPLSATIGIACVAPGQGKEAACVAAALTRASLACAKAKARRAPWLWADEESAHSA